MTKLENIINTALANFFHLPTFLALAFVAVIVVWRIYDVGLDFGDGFFRLYSNRGNINLIWLDGCCELDW